MGDKDRFLPPRPYWASDEEYEATRDGADQDLLEAGWRRFKEAVEEEGTDPSDEWLDALLREGVPEAIQGWLLSYLIRLRIQGREGGRPKRRPDNLHVKDRELYASTGGTPPRKAFMVWRFRRRWLRYRSFETTNRPRPGNRHRMKRDRDGVWRVKDPQGQAKVEIAKRYPVACKTLEKWHGEVPDSYGPDVD